MLRQFQLVDRVKEYDPSADEDAINRAYVYAVKMHGSQVRASGDPYFSHPVEVAGLLTRFKLDTASIVGGLLHDTIEDTGVTLEEIEKLFGPEVAKLVDGVTKLSRLELQSDEAKQAENFRKLVLAMSEDIRVLLIKLADRLHNMRTLHFIKKPEKRRRIALETMEIYAPLAERIGIHEIKNELEDLAFAELHPDERESIVARLKFLKDQEGSLIERIKQELEANFKAEGLEAEVYGREKTPYSIWRKMKRKNVGFEQLSDIMAFRVLVDNIGDCYRALGVIHSRYPIVPGRFKDYISLPKPNGYRSLHSGVFGPEHQRIEVQIRTRDMHAINELGVAAHWQYKQGGPTTEGKQYRWLRELLDILEHAAGPEEFLENTRMEMFQDQVFCFTPKGDLHALPRGSCAVDFAYGIHSEVGNKCVGAKVNGRMMPLRTQLKNGDQVEIITSKAQTPSQSWERFVVTGKAKACIRRFFRIQQRGQNIDLGKAILDRAFRQEDCEYTEKGVDGIAKVFKMPGFEDVLAAVGEGLLSAHEVVVAVYPGLKSKPEPLSSPNFRAKFAPTSKHGTEGKSASQRSQIKGIIPGMVHHFAGCCHPLPGDRIVGIITTGRGITVHTIDCENLAQYQDSQERWIDLAWDGEAVSNEPHTGRLNMVISNDPNSLGNLSTVVAKNMGLITNLKVTHRSGDFSEVILDLEVRDVKHLTNIIAALRASSAISSVERARH